MTLADVAAERVDAFSEARAHRCPRCALIHIHAGPPVGSQLEPRGWTLTSDLSFQHLAAVLAVGHAASACISTAAVGHQHVSVEAVALVAPVRVHTPVFARPRLQPTLIQILIAGLAGEARVALALIGSHTVSVLASRLAHGLAVAPGLASPAPAAVHSGTVATQASGGGHLPRPPSIKVCTCSEEAAVQ